MLKDVSLTIPARTSVALVGESGAGKSTLVDLLTLALRPRKGELLIDGVPGDEIELQSWRRQISYVSQETVIIAHRLSTIRNVDHVYLFDRSRLMEQGPYETLRDAEESRFGKLVAMQSL